MSKVLSVIVTDLGDYFQEPIILPPLQPDVLGIGKPSDHSVPLAVTYYTDRMKPKKAAYTIKNVRPFPDSGIAEFGRWIQEETFSNLASAKSPDTCVEIFEQIIKDKIEQIFPEKQIRIYDDDKEFMTKEMRKIRRQKSREYRRKNKSPKFNQLHLKFCQLRKENSQKFIKKIEELKSCNIGQFFKKVKLIGARIGEKPYQSFTLPSHATLNLSAQQSAEKIAQHFSAISQQYQPIEPNRLPERVRNKIFHPNVESEAPILEEYQIYEILKKRKLKNSKVPGDIPTKLKKEFLPELCGPVATIFNLISQTGLYPRQWVTEYVTPIPKVPSPETEDDLRNISLTADLSKDYENF